MTPVRSIARFRTLAPIFAPALSVLALAPPAPVLFVPTLSEVARQALFFVPALSVLALQVCKAETMAKAPKAPL